MDRLNNEQNNFELKNTQKKALPAISAIYIIWLFLSAFFMYMPARIIALSLIPGTLQRFSSNNLDVNDPGEIIGAFFIGIISFLVICVLSIVFSRIARLRLVILAFGVLFAMTLILFFIGKTSATKNHDAYKESATQKLIEKEKAISSPNVKIVGDNLEYNNGAIAFTLPSRFLLIQEAGDQDKRTIFSDHSDHITMQIYDDAGMPPAHCDWAGEPPCIKNSYGVEIGSTKKGKLFVDVYNYRVFSKKSLGLFYQFDLESTTFSIDGRQEPLDANLDAFNNQLKNSFDF